MKNKKCPLGPTAYSVPQNAEGCRCSSILQGEAAPTTSPGGFMGERDFAMRSPPRGEGINVKPKRPPEMGQKFSLECRKTMFAKCLNTTAQGMGGLGLSKSVFPTKRNVKKKKNGSLVNMFRSLLGPQTTEQAPSTASMWVANGDLSVFILRQNVLLTSQKTGARHCHRSHKTLRAKSSSCPSPPHRLL